MKDMKEEDAESPSIERTELIPDARVEENADGSEQVCACS